MSYEDVNIKNVGQMLDDLNEPDATASKAAQFFQCGKVLLIGTSHDGDLRRDVDACIQDKDAATVCGGRFSLQYTDGRKRVLVKVKISFGAYFKRRPSGKLSFEFNQALMEALLDEDNFAKLELKPSAKKALGKKIKDNAVDAGDVDWALEVAVK